MSLTIRSVLKGCKTGRPQTVGVMTIVPLISELEDERFDLISPIEGDLAMTFPEVKDKDTVSEKDVTRVSTTGYGTLRFTNASGTKTVIIPAQSAYLTKLGAQDHTMMKAGIVMPNKERAYNDASCIQSTQPGLIPAGRHHMVVLPMALREEAIKLKNKPEFGKFWPPLGAFLQSMGALQQDRYGRGGVAHLDHFISHFDKELSEFVAEFEIVEGMVGAIVLINGAVVGIERAPSRRYWASVWEALIRECYGSLAIFTAKKIGDKDAKLRTPRIPLDTRNVECLSDLAKALQTATQKEESQIKDLIRDLLDDDFSVEVDEKAGTCEVLSAKHRQFTGQMVRDGSRVVYASLVLTKEWPRYADSAKRDKKWKKAEEFSL